MLTAADFYNQLCNLLPPGPAWDREQSAVAAKMLDAWAEELARVYNRAQALVEEADPRTTLELLLDYERIFGLPTDCMAGQDLTLEQRRQALVLQMVSMGGQSRAYFIALAAAAGYTITITEFKKHTVLSGVNYPLYNEDWHYAWRIEGADHFPITYWKVNGGVNEPLASWGNNLLVCLLRRFKPAHAVLIFPS